MYLMLAPFLLACDPVTQDPLVSSPDKTLTDSVAVSAQVATGETVTYTMGALENTIYNINVRRKEGSNPTVIVCEPLEVNCTSNVGVDATQLYDGTIILHPFSSGSELYIYVGDIDGNGDESKYSITASKAETSTLGSALTSEDIFGVVYLGETADYTLEVVNDGTTEYEITATPDVGGIDALRGCSEFEAVCAVDNQVVISSKFKAAYTGTLYVFVDNDGNTPNSIFQIKATTTTP